MILILIVFNIDQRKEENVQKCSERDVQWHSRASELRSLISELEESHVTLDSHDTSESDNSSDGAEFRANESNEDPDNGEDVAIHISITMQMVN